MSRRGRSEGADDGGREEDCDDKWGDVAACCGGVQVGGGEDGKLEKRRLRKRLVGRKHLAIKG